jgi:hypothetical protein
MSKVLIPLERIEKRIILLIPPLRWLDLAPPWPVARSRRRRDAPKGKERRAGAVQGGIMS